MRFSCLFLVIEGVLVGVLVENVGVGRFLKNLSFIVSFSWRMLVLKGFLNENAAASTPFVMILVIFSLGALVFPELSHRMLPFRSIFTAVVGV